jgi:hypothetical protein
VAHDRPSDETDDENKLEVLCLQSKKIIYTVRTFLTKLSYTFSKRVVKNGLELIV